MLLIVCRQSLSFPLFLHIHFFFFFFFLFLLSRVSNLKTVKYVFHFLPFVWLNTHGDGTCGSRILEGAGRWLLVRVTGKSWSEWIWIGMMRFAHIRHTHTSYVCGQSMNSAISNNMYVCIIIIIVDWKVSRVKYNVRTLFIIMYYLPMITHGHTRHTHPHTDKHMRHAIALESTKTTKKSEEK